MAQREFGARLTVKFSASCSSGGGAAAAPGLGSGGDHRIFTAPLPCCAGFVRQFAIFQSLGFLEQGVGPGRVGPAASIEAPGSPPPGTGQAVGPLQARQGAVGSVLSCRRSQVEPGGVGGVISVRGEVQPRPPAGSGI